MKKTLMMLVMALMMGFTMQAQNPQGMERRHHKFDGTKFVEARVAQLDKELNLTPKQKEAITQIFTENMEQMRLQMRPEKAKVDEMKASRDEMNNKIAAVLDNSQKEKFEQIKNRAPRGPRHHGGRPGHGPRHGQGHHDKGHCDKAEGKCCKAEGKCDKAEGKCDKAEGKCDKAQGKCDKAQGKCDKAQGKCAGKGDGKGCGATCEKQVEKK